jgi:hypothetical protein
MTSPRDFAVVLSKLSMQLRALDVDEATIRAYHEVLGQHSLDALRTTAAAYAADPGRKWLPTTGEWTEALQACEEQVVRKRLTGVRLEPWHVDCPDCEDTGWVYGLTCDGGAEAWPEAGPREPRGRQKTEFRGNKRAVGYVAFDRVTIAPCAPVCGLERPHAPHTWTRACPCRATNRTYQRHYRYEGGAA